jgi:hypothetical protein
MVIIAPDEYPVNADTRPTPGPWHVEGFRNDDGDLEAIEITAGVFGTIVTLDLNGDLETLGANARLIASSHDLLAVCQEVLRDIERAYKNNVVWPSTQKQLRAAITKATGGQP